MHNFSELGQTGRREEDTRRKSNTHIVQDPSKEKKKRSQPS